MTVTIVSQTVQKRSEMDLFSLIHGYGGLIFSTGRGVRKGHIEEESGRRDISHLEKLLQEVVNELVENYGVIMPPEGPKLHYLGDYSGWQAPPEGKQWYWPWHHRMKNKFLRSEYNKVICSACPFSTGDINEMDSHIPCGKVRGVIYNLIAPYMCGMVDWSSSGPPRSGLWSKKDLIENIRDEGGDDAVKKFTDKEASLIEAYRESKSTE